ncbi:MAG: hypothetical protein MUE60_03230 [Candidatus Eisenbacteria bacterium]|jgi:hypothetical protein|nr:hypothetical protein [Candidatus Eisenbacteria bacterium]
MKRVSVHLDYDTIHEVQDVGLTPSLLSQRVKSAAMVLGHIGGTFCHAEWAKYPASCREAFEAEGWSCGEPLATAAGWTTLKDELARDRGMVQELTVIMASSNRGLASRAKELRESAAEVVFWFAGTGPWPSAQGWDRTDSLTRVLGLSEGGVCLVVDVQGLVESSWSVQGMVDVESLLDALGLAVGRMGAVSGRVALADWHTLPVMRNKDGDPITNEAEALFRKAGYLTPVVPPLVPGQPLPEDAAKALERLGHCRDLLIVGRGPVAAALARSRESNSDSIHLWSDERPDTPGWVAWQPIADALRASAGASRPLSTSERSLMPGVWARVGLFTDRAIAGMGAETIAAGDLVAALLSGMSFVRRPDQALALIREAVSRGTLREVDGTRPDEQRYVINDEDPGLAFIRDLLKALIEMLGEGPGEGQGVPVPQVLDGLSTRLTTGEGGTRDPRVFLAWLNLLVDEGILLRFPGAAADGTEGASRLAFSPAPLKDVEVPAPSTGHAKAHIPPSRPSPVRVPPRLREHLIIVLDNYSVRHGKSAAPLSVVRKALSEYGGNLVEAAVREGIRSGDLQPLKGAPGTLAISQQSKFAQLVVGRKNKAVSALKRMAPMGQPISEARIRSTFSDSLKVRDDEAGELLSLLLKERILRREPQIMTSGGPSYTLALEDTAVVRAHEHAMSRDARRGRPGGEGPHVSGRGHRPRERRRP